MYLNIIWSHKTCKTPQSDTLYLSLKDINHLERIYTKYKLIPESFDEVRINYLADRNQLIRFIIKELDILLKPGGKFIINSTYSNTHGNFIRSTSQIKHEYSISTNGRYRLVNENIDKLKFTLEYIKEKKTLERNDTIDKWSFGIITNGNKNEKIVEIIDSIVAQNIPKYEIIICGHFTYANTDKLPIQVIPDIILKNDLRAPITLKKNNIARVAVFNNLMIVHDRYLLPNDWYQKMKNYGNYFDILAFPNIGENGGRVNDWGLFSVKPSQIGYNISYQIPYNKWTEFFYAQGGLLLIKKNLFELNNLDSRLFWGELEDVQFSQKANLNGLFYYFDVNNKIYTFSGRLKESNYSSNLSSIRSNLKFLYFWCKNYINYYINFFNA